MAEPNNRLFGPTEELWKFLIDGGIIVDCTDAPYKQYVKMVRGDPHICAPRLKGSKNWRPFPGPNTCTSVWRPYNELTDDKLPDA